MAIEIFNRHENKYLIDTETFLYLQKEISEYMELDAYNKDKKYYTITNIYYDTDDDYLIRNSLAKPRYKEKLRVRGYGDTSNDSKVFLEIKKKFNGFTNKRRTAIRIEDMYSFLETGKVPKIESYMNKQVLFEIKYILENYKLKPKLYLAYDRMAYFTEDKNVRISFDKAIRTRRDDLKLELGDFGDNLLDDDKILMEVKVLESIPIWLVKLLSQYKIYPTNFSKYGEEYTQSYLKEALIC